LHRNAGNDAVDDGEAGATRRRCQRGVRALGDPFGRDEEIELDSCVDRVRAARQQRFGAAGPPRRGVEAGEGEQLLGRDDAVAQARVIEALYRSAESGEAVRL